jgi:phosphoribosylanthranilate isomerase
MNEEASLVNDIAHSCGLTMVQLHGNESPNYCQSMTCPVLKAFRVQEEALPDLAPYRGVVKGFLLDTYRQGQAGGTGATFNWDLINRLALPGPLILAGGLTPDNIGAAIRQTRPYAVDVNSGVETSPGRKDLAQVQRLFLEIRNNPLTAS